MLGHSMWIAAQQGGVPDGAAALGLGMLLFNLLVVVGVLVGMWKVFVKANKPGWAALVPIYNLFVLAEVGGKPSWWAILLFVPLVNLIVFVVICMGVAKNFGKNELYGIGLALLGFIFFPLLGFGNARYRKVA
ncbi:MAG: DUF5684 domain-containing protein [Planctomycetaceae bacterium]|jgi:hypothetical protein